MSQNTPEERACQASVSHGITSETLNTILTEVGAKPISTPLSKVIEACNQFTDSPKKQASVAESKRILENFKEKLINYPKHLSYDGSVVLCVMLSIKESEGISLSGLPQVDRDIILSQLPLSAPSKMASGEATISIEFDEQKDFILKYDEPNSPKCKSTLHFFNSVIHPEKQASTEVPVENDGEKVKVGSALVLDQRRIQKLVGNTQEKSKRKDEEEPPKRQAVAGRNAYEIRADVLQMAIDWLGKSGLPCRTDENLLALAKKFYQFVENRR